MRESESRHGGAGERGIVAGSAPLSREAAGRLLDGLRGVRWPARSLTRSAIHGEHRSHRSGASPEFMDYRAYHQGDDSSKIDWKLFGRTERVAVRLAHDDSSLPTTALVDASASMAFPTENVAKWRLAGSIALGLAAVALGDGDPVGLAVAGGSNPRTLAPRGRRGTITDIINVLSHTVPGGSAPLASTLSALRASKRVAIVSDFLDDAEDTIRQARGLIAGGAEVYAIHVVATEELHPVAQPLVSDPENSAVRRPLGADILAGYREEFAKWREWLSTEWHRTGAIYRLAATDDDPVRVVRRIALASAA